MRALNLVLPDYMSCMTKIYLCDFCILLCAPQIQRTDEFIVRLFLWCECESARRITDRTKCIRVRRTQMCRPQIHIYIISFDIALGICSLRKVAFDVFIYMFVDTQIN